MKRSFIISNAFRRLGNEDFEEIELPLHIIRGGTLMKRSFIISNAFRRTINERSELMIHIIKANKV